MPRSITERLRVALGALLLAVAVACGSGPEPDELTPGGSVVVTTDHGVRATVEVGDPVRGSNAFRVSFQAPHDTDARLVSGYAFMPAHGHGTTSASIAGDAPGFVATLSLYMRGTWEVHLEVDVGGQSDEIVFTIDIP